MSTVKQRTVAKQRNLSGDMFASSESDSDSCLELENCNDRRKAIVDDAEICDNGEGRRSDTVLNDFWKETELTAPYLTSERSGCEEKCVKRLERKEKQTVTL